MSGETEAAVSGWTVDTLHEHFSAQLQQQITDLRTLFGQQVTDMRTLLSERHDTQTKALDAGFKAAEQAVHTALISAEKAVGKAETAADKRFESVNEFRKQLADQTATFPTRLEVTARMDGMAADTARNSQRIAELELRLTSRLDTAQGRTGGERFARTEKRLDNAQVIAWVIAAVAIAGLVVTHFTG